MQQKLYISSTYSDLEKYREVILDNINFLSKYFTPVRVMEYMMPPVEQSIVEECLSDVANCDIYVLIIGKRYGSIEPLSKVSYTENEYNLAVRLGKKIIPLIADEKAETLSEQQTDNVTEYNRFKNLVKNQYLTYVKGFTNPYHLYTQLLQSLYAFSETKWTVGDELKYYCDRSLQYRDFVTSKVKNKLNIFTVVGKENDRADCFSMRMGKYEFGLKKEYIQTPLRSSTVIGNVSKYEKHRTRLITHLMENFLSASDDWPKTVEECLDYFKKSNLNNLFVTLYLSRPDIQNAILKKTLVTFFTELNENCRVRDITIYYVVIFQFENSEQVDARIADWIIGDSDIKKSDPELGELDVLPPVNLGDVNDWMKKYALQDYMAAGDQEKINSLLSNYFKNQNRSEDMNQTLDIIDKIINIINEKK
jgi:hypothetical protein